MSRGGNHMNAICGANCEECEFLKNNKCKGCKNTNGCPFGKKCWVANYIEIGGKEKFNELKKELIKEFNLLDENYDSSYYDNEQILKLTEITEIN